MTEFLDQLNSDLQAFTVLYLMKQHTKLNTLNGAVRSWVTKLLLLRRRKTSPAVQHRKELLKAIHEASWKMSRKYVVKSSSLYNW